MRMDIVTIFPEMCEGVFNSSILKRAQEAGILTAKFTNFRDFAEDKHKKVDDTPFGGGSGMVLKPEPLFRAVESIKRETNIKNRRILLMDPAGKPFTQEKAKELAKYEQLIFICGHYEGFDERVAEFLADEAISIGNYVLTGGELPAMVIADAVARMLPGVLGSAESAPTDSFYEGILGSPVYTKPREYRGMEVPEILLSGDHAKIRNWRRKKALERTKKTRPELLKNVILTDEEKKYLEDL
ncbi:MAG: tRNA (guanosine(37)-N1)-methyltransferase TrmD [Selenomonadaceae bacterium]|nr:tRNA (guanosine(37)-N1)-methyltransferase TrmD [Selenomonadaceae bacterium]